MEIKINQSDYDKSIFLAKAANRELKITPGNKMFSLEEIPALHAYIEWFGDMSMAIWHYKHILDQGLDRLILLEQSLVRAEGELIK